MKGGGILGELVHQFADPYALYRELVQNAIDAGSRRIDVLLRYEPGKDGGMATASVRDFGEGMTREIIERYLLTKFRSTKEGDLTKIGRFGIGFMSVFALDPDLVVVETGRDGEDWRLLLHPDHRYELLAAPVPIEGTTVALHKQLHVGAYRELVARSRDAVSRWCRHSDVDVAFAAGDEAGGAPPPAALVREPFTVDAPFVVEAKDEDIHVVAGPSRSPTPLHGFYNRGLTLLESEAPLVAPGTSDAVAPGVTFKVMSRLLEHTLTRDNVRHDAGFERVVARVKELVAGALRERLVRELRTAAERGGGEGYEALLRCATAGKRPLLPLADLRFPLAGGGTVDGRELVRQARVHDGVLVCAPGDAGAAVVAALARRAIPVLLRGQGTAETAARLAGTETRDASRAFTTAGREHALTGGGRALLEALAMLGAAASWKVRGVVMAKLEGAASGKSHALLHSIDAPVAAAESGLSPLARSCPPILCLDPDHELVVGLVGLAARSPRLAALLCLRLVLASHGGIPEPVAMACLEACLGKPR